MTAPHGGEPPVTDAPTTPAEQPTQALPVPAPAPAPAPDADGPQKPASAPGPSDSPTDGPSDAPRRLTPPAGPGWAQADRPTAPPPPAPPVESATTVLPGAAARPAPTVPPRPAGRPVPVPPRPAGRPEQRPSSARSTGTGAVPRGRRARLALKRIDPWSVFVFTLVASIFVGVALVVAAAVLYVLLGALGVTESVNQLFGEIAGANSDQSLITAGRVVGGAAVLGAVNVVFLTLLATLSALLYNLCASFTGGIELTLGERD